MRDEKTPSEQLIKEGFRVVVLLKQRQRDLMQQMLGIGMAAGFTPDQMNALTAPGMFGATPESVSELETKTEEISNLP